MTERYYLLKIYLLDIEPEIWRLFVVPARITLDRLHDVIQVVMGWKDYHLQARKGGAKKSQLFGIGRIVCRQSFPMRFFMVKSKVDLQC